MTKKIGFLIFEGVYFTDVVITRIVFEEANYILSILNKPRFYETFSIGEKEKYKVSPSTVEHTKKIVDLENKELDILIIPGGKIENVIKSKKIEVFIKNVYPNLERLVSVCGGAVALAHFGYLDNKKAATHPIGRYEEIKQKYPKNKISLVKKAVVKDGKIMTSGGVFKGVDLALAIVKEDLGVNIKNRVINEIRYFGEGKF